MTRRSPSTACSAQRHEWAIGALPLPSPLPLPARTSTVTPVSARRRAALLLVGLLSAWLATAVVTAGPAAAHAELVSTSPAEGARLDTPPQQVTLTFSEGVSVAAGYARVLDAKGNRIDSGTPAVSGDVLTVPLRSGL